MVNQDVLRTEIKRICKPLITEGEVAKDVGISISLFSKWLNGHKELGPTARKKVTDYLLIQDSNDKWRPF